MRTVIVLPTYNEQPNISDFLHAVRRISADIDVLVIDDNSPDGTAATARAVGEQVGGVRVVVRADKSGLGSAYRAGFRQVLSEGYGYIVSMDADMSHDPANIPEMLRLLDSGFDAVIGSRYVQGGGTIDWPVQRQLLSRWGNAYTRMVLRIAPRDCTSGFRAYKAEPLAAIDPDGTSAEGYAFLTELIRRLTRGGYTIAETPIVFRDRVKGTSKMSGRIIAESMLLVTRWGLSDLVSGYRRRAR